MAVDPYGIEPMAGMTALGWGGPSRIQQIAAMHGRPPAQTQTVPMQYSFGPQGQIGRSPFPAQSNPYGSNIGSAIASYMNGQNRWGQPPPSYGNPGGGSIGPNVGSLMNGNGFRYPASAQDLLNGLSNQSRNFGAIRQGVGSYMNGGGWGGGGVWNGPPRPYTSPTGIQSQWNNTGRYF